MIKNNKYIANLKVASWNVEARLSYLTSKRRGSSSQIIKMIKSINADVLVLLEAHSELLLSDLGSYQQLIGLGYHVHSVPYEDDTSSRKDTMFSRSSLMLLSKLPIKQFKTIRLGEVRNALTATIESETGQLFRVIGIHLDDRSEETRLKQVVDLSKIINKSSLPTIVMGDFNAMHGEVLWPSKLLRSRLAKLTAHIILPVISLKAIEMARGETLKYLETNTNLTDADTSHRPTTTPKMIGREWLPSIRLIQIDHIFVSESIKVNKFSVAPDGGSDHRAIIANISIK